MPEKSRPRPLLRGARPPAGAAVHPARVPSRHRPGAGPPELRLFGGGSRDNLFLPGAAAGGGTAGAPAALPSAPSLSPSPLRQPPLDEPSLRPPGG